MQLFLKEFNFVLLKRSCCTRASEFPQSTAFCLILCKGVRPQDQN